MRYTDLTANEICHSIILTADKTEGVILSELRDEYAVGENNREDFIQRFDNAIRKLGVFCAAAGEDTEVAAKAAAYDRVKSIAHDFVQRATGDAQGILNEAELTDHIQWLEGQLQTTIMSFGGMNLVAYASQLEQMCQTKDAEIALLRQKIAQLQQERN